MITRIKIRKLTKKIKELESKLIETRRTLYNIYDGIEILLNNMGEINTERFQDLHSLYEETGLLRDVSNRFEFEGVLIGIGLSKTSIEAYLHGFLKTYRLEWYEKVLVSKLNYDHTQLKKLGKEPIEYFCWNCEHKIKTKGPVPDKCDVCEHYPIFPVPVYTCLYSRDYETRALDNKKRFNLLDLLNKRSGD